jgi:threonylcarbamoyladenosine tRNA methylthiotransferase MtaB
MENENENTLNKESKRVSVHTLGCRLNFSETGSISQGFVDRGYELVPFGEEAEVIFINTCTVTDEADSSCRALIRKAQRSSPEGKIVVAGCYAQMDPKTISEMQGVDLILGTSEKYKVFDYLGEEAKQVVAVEKSNLFWGASTTPADNHTRAFLKIQDGCNYVCSFCIIPQARGRSRTITVAEAVSQAKDLVANGYKEIVLTGVNIGEYESTSGEKLTDLVKQILDIDGLERMRLSSVEPNTITDELLDVLEGSDKFMDHFHIPLQSGDDEILKQMRRKYDVSFYKDVINKILSRFPNAAIGADMIVGFPGETEEQFNATYNLAKELPITHFHVFPYSKRKGTIASRSESHIHQAVKKERSRALNMFGEAKLAMLSEDMVGTSSEVLFERRNKSGFFTGYSTNFVKVFVKTESELKNQIRRVHLTSFSDGKLYGELIQ